MMNGDPCGLNKRSSDVPMPWRSPWHLDVGARAELDKASSGAPTPRPHRIYVKKEMITGKESSE
jgi:hypothetical protein